MLIYDNDAKSVFMTENLPLEKVKSLTQKYRNIMKNPKPKLREITSSIGSICSKGEAVMPAFFHIRYLQQQQVEYIKK